MIEGKKNDEKKEYETPSTEYRQIKSLNQSMIKVFDDNPAEFYRTFILNQPKREKTTISKQLGSLVDFMLLECEGDDNLIAQNFECKFNLYEGEGKSSQVFILADRLFEITKRDTINGVIKTEFPDRFKEAFAEVQRMDKYKNKTVEAGLEDFLTKGREYFDKKIENMDKEVIDNFILRRGQEITTQLLTDEFTIRLFSPGEHDDYRKFPIEWTYLSKEFGAMDCKIELDRLLIDHEHKQIFLDDLKCNFDNEEFEPSAIKWGYYIQGAFYYLGVAQWAITQGLGEYKIHPMRFIVADTSLNKRRPLIYKTTEQHLKEGIYGFDRNGLHYRGVNELMEEIMWANESNCWDVSRKNYENNGVIIMKSFSSL